MASGHVNRKGRTHGCTDQACDVKSLLTNPEPSTHGPFRPFARCRNMSGVGAKQKCRAHARSDAIDPEPTLCRCAKQREVCPLLTFTPARRSETTCLNLLRLRRNHFRTDRCKTRWVGVRRLRISARISRQRSLPWLRLLQSRRRGNRCELESSGAHIDERQQPPSPVWFPPAFPLFRSPPRHT
jgi:hypothetical protein